MSKKTKKIKKKSTRRNKKQSNLSKVLSSSTTQYQARTKFFEELPEHEIYKSIEKVKNHRFFKGAVNFNLNRDFEEIFSPVIPHTSTAKTLAWLCGVILAHKEKIESAISLEQEITSKVLQGEYQNAYRTCEEIDSLCGASLWTYKTKLALIETSDTPIEDTNKITPPNNSALAYIKNNCLQFAGEREFFTVTSTSVWNNIVRSAPNDLKDFLLYHLFCLNGEHSYNISSIVRYEKSSTILDIYHLLVNCLYLIKLKELPDADNTERLISRYLSDSIDNETVYNFCRRAGKSKPFKLKESNLYDLYHEGKYEKICRIFNNTENKYSSFHEILLVVKSNIRSNNLQITGFLGEIVENLKKVIIKSSGHEKSREHLLCIAYTFRTLPWFRDLSIFLQSEIPFSSRRSRENYLEALLMSDSSNNPEKAAIFKNEIRSDYIAAAKNSSQKQTAISVHRYLNDPSIKKISTSRISEDLSIYYTALRDFNNKNYKAACNNFDKIAGAEDKYLSSMVKGISAESLISSGKMDLGVKNFVDEFISGDGAHRFDIMNILFLIGKEYRNKSSIDYPIAISIFSRYISNELESDLQYSFEVFLNRNGARLPQDLFNRYDDFDNLKLIYFFKWICTQDIMSLYLEFPTIDAIEECRMEVCQHLVEKGEKSNRVLSEIKEINKSRAVKRAERKIDTSRIFVDTSSLTGRSSAQYRDLYERYQTLAKQDFSSSSDEAAFSDLVEFWEKQKNEKVLPEAGLPSIFSMIYLPEVKLNKKNAIFLSLVKLVRDEFTHGEKGLNNHLSTRIRHGVLPTTLRKPVKEEGNYIPESKILAEYISESRRFSNNSHAPIIFNELKQFSKKIDDNISLINDQWLQIVSLDTKIDSKNDRLRENALFDYSISPLESYAIQKNLTTGSTYDDFIYVAIDWLWKKTDDMLVRVQEKISRNAHNEILKCIEELKTSLIQKLGDTNDVQTICNSLDRVKDGVSRQIEIVCSWFTHGESDIEEEHDFNFAIDIAKKCIGVNPKIKSTEKLPHLKGRQLNYLVDVFIILFENAVSKSGLEKSELGLTCVIERNESTTKLKVSNLCKEDSVRSSDIQFYNEAYGDESFANESVSQEGGTGFFKIWSSLKRGLGIDHNLRINFNDNIFEVELSIPDIEKGLE